MLHHFLLIPDGSRRYSVREYLANVFSREGKFPLISQDMPQLEERIKTYVSMGRDPLYDRELHVDHLKDIDTDPAFLREAYRKAAQNIDSILRHVLARNNDLILPVHSVSLYALQPPNLHRKPHEIDAMLLAEIEEFEAWARDQESMQKTHFTFVGDMKLLESHPLGKLYQTAAKALENASQGKELSVFILAPYEGSWEINHAVHDGKFDESRLIVPPVDLVVRSSGEKRISEGIPLQCRNAEYVFRNEYSPDFTLVVFREVVEEFYQRARRFGK